MAERAGRSSWLWDGHRSVAVSSWSRRRPIDRAPRNFTPGLDYFPSRVPSRHRRSAFPAANQSRRGLSPRTTTSQSAKKGGVGLAMEALGQEARGGLFPPILPCRPFDGVLVRRLGEVKQVLLLLSGGAHHRKYYRSGGKRRPPAPTASHFWLTFAGVLPRGDGRERRSSGTAQASVPPSHGSPYPPAM